jgi:alkyl hydroperoxide reductase subunit AhpF
MGTRRSSPTLVDVNERGEIVIQPDCSTSFPGIFAAGDITNAFGKRIIIASGEGARQPLRRDSTFWISGEKKARVCV